MRRVAFAVTALLTWAVPAVADAAELRVSSHPNRSNSVLLDGKQLSGSAYVYVPNETTITRVSFWLDDPDRTGAPRQVENTAPWDFAGGTSSSATAWNTAQVADGPHTITARIERGSASEVISATFTVTNAHEVMLSVKPDRSNPAPLNGQTLTQKGMFVFTQPSIGVSEVRFHVDDPNRTQPPLTIEKSAPHDLAGTASNGTANPFDSSTLSVGEHTITAALDISGQGTKVLHATFTVPSPCAPVVCEDVLVDLPHNLDFTGEAGGLKDANGVGTGFTWIDKPTKGTGYIPANLRVDTAEEELEITTTAGLASGTADSQDNALGVGIDAPNQATLLRTTIVDPPAGTGNYEQGGLYFGNDESNYVKLTVQSAGSGTRIQLLREVDDASAEINTLANLAVAGKAVRLEMLTNPSDRTVTGSYRIGENGTEKTLGKFTVPGEFFSFDAAGIDPRLGTRSFGGIFASHRRGPAPLVYRFSNFSASVGQAPPPPPPPDGIRFTRTSSAVSFPTSIDYGPDGRVYVSELFGKIHALTLDANGAVVADQVITALGSRLTLGLTVDPNSTPGNVVLWATHSSPSLDNGTPNSGVVSRLSGTNFSTRTDVITGLPRAKANHGTNNLKFGPDGRLYIAQGGNTGAGAPNNGNTEFGTMQEQPLSAAMLVADVRNPAFDGSCANTSDIFGPPPCDVQVYASGLRNTYDFVFHPNGSLYAPDNGLGVVGTFPPSPTPPCLGMGDTRSWTVGGHNPGEQPDGLNRLEQGRYYGHPNPYRDECVFRDGRYQSVPAPANYTPPIHNLGLNRSANGTIAYQANRFCGRLKGDLLIANYSVGDDLTRIRLSSDGLTVASAGALLTGFTDPLPLAQAPDGRVFVGEFGTNKLTVLTPDERGCWSTGPQLPQVVLDPGSSALEGKLYLVAGKNFDTHISTVRVFDPVAGTWSTAADLPGPAVENPAVVAHAGKLYAFGGSTAPFSGARAEAHVFDPSTGAWSPLAPMPTARGGATARVLDGRIYVIGGMAGNGASVSTVEVYDPATDTWSAGPDLGTRRDNPGSAVLDGRLYVFGGRTRNADGTTPNGTLASTEMLDPEANAWVGRAPMPTGRRTFAVGTLGGRAQVVGGEASGTGDGTFAANEEYDAATDTWRALEPIPLPRHGTGFGTINGALHVVGGGPQSGSAFSAAHEIFRLP